jgi:ABC-2 type transport system ATP-binding protein
MNCMTGLLIYQQGSIQLLGHEIAHHKRSINKLFGFVPQDFSFYQELSPVENLAFFGAWSGLNKTDIKNKTTELLEVLGLTDVRNKKVQEFSGGMKRRVNLAIGVIHNPQILFLDEPTVGVDVHTRHAIITYLKKLNEEGTTLIYTSHQLSEAEDLCNKVALIDLFRSSDSSPPGPSHGRDCGAVTFPAASISRTTSSSAKAGPCSHPKRCGSASQPPASTRAGPSSPPAARG